MNGLLYWDTYKVAVIPVPSAIYGEEPVAFVVADCELSREDILQWLRSRVARYQLPVRIIFTRTLPRTHNGKICKRELKNQLSSLLITTGNEQ